VVLVVSMGVRGSSRVVSGLAVLAGCALLVGCGGSSAPRASLAERVCDGARQAAAKALGSPLAARVVSPAAASLQCVLTGRQVRVTIVSQAGGRAYTEFDTEVTHQEQVFGPGVHDPAQIPSPITVPGSVVAVWIRAQVLLVATNATPTTGGAYVTVAVSGRAAPAKIALRVATAAARATFAAHPNGPS
jgi:hypothetical protein